MKKFFAILLTVCLMASLFVMPASAALFEDFYLDLDASNIIYHEVAATATPVGEAMEISAYPIANIFDGDTTTTAAISFWGQSYKQNGATKQELKDIFLTGDLVIDLGAQYEVSALEFIAPTADQAAAINAAYPSAVALNHKESWWAGGVNFYTENPVENADATATAATMLTGKVNNGVTPPAGSYRYIKFNGRYYNQGPGFINELRVKVKYPADDTSVKYEFMTSQTKYLEPAYPIENILDGKENTAALVGGRNGATGAGTTYSLRVIDLGVAKNYTSLKVVVPSNYNDLLSAIGMTSNANYANIYLSETKPNLSAYNASPETVDPNLELIYGGNLNNAGTIALDSEKDYRYVVLVNTMGSYSGMISELVFVEDDRAGSATFKTTAAAGEVVATSGSFNATSTGAWTPVGEFSDYPSSNVIDDDANSIAWLINRDTNGTHRDAEYVIDLGKDYELSAIDWVLPTSDEATAILTAKGYTVVGGSAEQQSNAINAWSGAGISIYGKNSAGTVNNKLTVYGTIGPDDWRHATQNLGAGNAYRYIVINCPQNYTFMLKDFTVKDLDGNELIGATKDVVRFYVAPTLTSKYYDTEEFGMYIVPFALFEDEGDAITSGVQMKMEGKIVTGQNYAANMSDIPAEAADVPMVVVPFVKLGGDYFYGNASSQFTLNGLK